MTWSIKSNGRRNKSSKSQKVLSENCRSNVNRTTDLETLVVFHDTAVADFNCSNAKIENVILKRTTMLVKLCRIFVLVLTC